MFPWVFKAHLGVACIRYSQIDSAEKARCDGLFCGRFNESLVIRS